MSLNKTWETMKYILVSVAGSGLADDYPERQLPTREQRQLVQAGQAAHRSGSSAAAPGTAPQRQQHTLLRAARAQMLTRTSHRSACDSSLASPSGCGCELGVQICAKLGQLC